MKRIENVLDNITGINYEKETKPMEKTFLDVKVGDTVVCYDEYLHDYVEHYVKVENIEEDKEYATESNPKGKVLYGKDISDDNDETMICTVYESNFVKCK